MVTWLTYLNILVEKKSSKEALTQFSVPIFSILHNETMVWIQWWSPNFTKECCIESTFHTRKDEILTRVKCVISCQIQRYHALIRNTSPLDIGHINSSISLSSMASRPKSSRTAPYLFIVLGRMILNLDSWTHFSKFST